MLVYVNKCIYICALFTTKTSNHEKLEVRSKKPNRSSKSY